MFIGHYFAAALVTPLAVSGRAGMTPPLKLWHGFVAVQLVDFIWAIFILTGIEQARIAPGLTQASPLDLHFMPYTHSLLFTLIWAGVGALIFKGVTRSKGAAGALIFGVLVLSHWLADVLVHIPDMTFWPGSDKIGLGLWKTVWISVPLEIFITLGALMFYLKRTVPRTRLAPYWAFLFMSVLVGLQLYANFGPAPASVQEAALSAFAVFTLLAFWASRFERTRLLLISHESSDPS